MPWRYQCYKICLNKRLHHAHTCRAPSLGFPSMPRDSQSQTLWDIDTTNMLRAYWLADSAEDQNLVLNNKTCFDTWWYSGCWVRATLIQKVDSRPWGADRITVVRLFFKTLHFFMLRLCWVSLRPPHNTVLLLWQDFRLLNHLVKVWKPCFSLKYLFWWP